MAHNQAELYSSVIENMEKPMTKQHDKLEGPAAAMPLLKSLANINRLTILCSLVEKEMSVSEMENTLDIRQPTLSQQLTRLRDDKLVTTRRDGKTIFYNINSKHAERVIEVLHDLYC